MTCIWQFIGMRHMSYLLEKHNYTSFSSSKECLNIAYVWTCLNMHICFILMLYQRNQNDQTFRTCFNIAISELWADITPRLAVSTGIATVILGSCFASVWKFTVMPGWKDHIEIMIYAPSEIYYKVIEFYSSMQVT